MILQFFEAMKIPGNEHKYLFYDNKKNESNEIESQFKVLMSD